MKSQFLKKTYISMILCVQTFFFYSCKQDYDPLTTEVWRGDRTEFKIVDCHPYGKVKLWLNPENSIQIAADLEKNWERYWPSIRKTYETNLRLEDDAEIGSVEMLKDKWELRIFDSFSEKDPMPDGRAILELIFFIGEEQLVPEWHVFLDDGEVTHCQPVF